AQLRDGLANSIDTGNGFVACDIEQIHVGWNLGQGLFNPLPPCENPHERLVRASRLEHRQRDLHDAQLVIVSDQHAVVLAVPVANESKKKFAGIGNLESACEFHDTSSASGVVRSCSAAVAGPAAQPLEDVE